LSTTKLKVINKWSQIIAKIFTLLVTGVPVNGTGMVPAAATMMNNDAAVSHLALLPRNNWDKHNHSKYNLAAPKDFTAAEKNAEGVDLLATHFGVPPEEAQKHLATLEAEKGKEKEYLDSPFIKFAKRVSSEWEKGNGEDKERMNSVEVGGLNPK
jgi:hypothetical protein